MKFFSFSLVLCLFFISLLFSCGIGVHKLEGEDNLGNSYVVQHTVIGKCNPNNTHFFIPEFDASDAQVSEDTYSQMLIDNGLNNGQVTRVAAVTRSHNAHGLALDGQKSAIYDEDTENILRAAGYQNSENCTDANPAIGDIVIYKNVGLVVHSGLVIDVSGTVPRVRSKWGWGPVYEHDLRALVLDFDSVTYYRQNCN